MEQYNTRQFADEKKGGLGGCGERRSERMLGSEEDDPMYRKKIVKPLPEKRAGLPRAKKTFARRKRGRGKGRKRPANLQRSFWGSAKSLSHNNVCSKGCVGIDRTKKAGRKKGEGGTYSTTGEGEKRPGPKKKKEKKNKPHLPPKLRCRSAEYHPVAGRVGK